MREEEQGSDRLEPVERVNSMRSLGCKAAISFTAVERSVNQASRKHLANACHSTAPTLLVFSYQS